MLFLRYMRITLKDGYMARFRITVFKSNVRKDKTYPVCLRISKNGKVKYIDLGLSATEAQWNPETDRFKKDRRTVPNYENYNALLNHYDERKDAILRKFAETRTDWTIAQFEEEFLGASRKGKIYDYWLRLIQNLKATGHIGNGKVYERDLHLFCLYDPKAKERSFAEIDVKYVNRLNMAMEKNGCCGNTRMHTLKTLRAVINKAIKEKEASAATYRFWKRRIRGGKTGRGNGKTIPAAARAGTHQELAATKPGAGKGTANLPVFLLLLRHELCRCGQPHHAEHRHAGNGCAHRLQAAENAECQGCQTHTHTHHAAHQGTVGVVPRQHPAHGRPPAARRHQGIHGRGAVQPCAHALQTHQHEP